MSNTPLTVHWRSQEEIDHLKYTIKECAIHIQHTNLQLQLQALRLIITA